MCDPPVAASVPGATVLLVDDNAAFRDITEMALSSLGHVVQPSGSPEAALATVSGSSQFELLITDVVMSTMNGVDLAAEVRRIRPEMKVLFCSGYPAAALARQGLDLSAGEFLMKPISLGALSSKITALLGQPGALT
jgi:two-component system cell cycle sensor histidine kinase/response regulator CckA